jgi:hypothetical protein
MNGFLGQPQRVLHDIARWSCSPPPLRPGGDQPDDDEIVFPGATENRLKRVAAVMGEC